MGIPLQYDLIVALEANKQRQEKQAQGECELLAQYPYLPQAEIKQAVAVGIREASKHKARMLKKKSGTEVSKLCKPSRFHVQCFLVTDGQSFSDWDFTMDTLEEAEECCNAQMAPSDQSLVLGHNFECNKTNRTYVNCIISFLRKNGKWIEIEKKTPLCLG